MTEVYSSLLAAKFSRCAFTRCRILLNISSSQLALSEALYAPVMDCGASLTLPLLCWRAHPPFRETEGKKLPHSIRQLALAISMRSMAESTEKFPTDAVAISESSIGSPKAFHHLSSTGCIWLPNRLSSPGMVWAVPVPQPCGSGFSK